MAAFNSAVNGLRNHHEAVKPTTWRGYVYRFDAQAYDPARTYAKDAEVMYDGTHYKCAVAVTSAEEFDPSKWTRVTAGIAHGYELIFVEDADFEQGGSGAGTPVGKDDFTAYRFHVGVDEAGAKRYSDPVCMKTRTGSAVDGDYDQFYDDTESTGAGNFPIDGGLLLGFLSSEWSSGTKEEFDSLAAGGNRW